METILTFLVHSHPQLIAAMLVMQTAGMVFKPIMTALEYYVKQTPSPDDDAALQKAEDSKIYKIIAWVIDYALRIKLPLVLPDKK